MFILKKIDSLIEKFSTYGLVVCVIGMLFLSLATIILRWVNYPLLWIDPLVRHMVFLGAFLGGVLATGKKQHIAIDVLSKFLEGKHDDKHLKMVQGGLGLVCALVLSWLFWGSLSFVKDSFEYEGIVFLGIHRGVLVSIIPLGMGLMIYRFLFIFLSSLKSE